MKPAFFLGVLCVIGMIVYYSFSGNQADAIYTQEVEAYRERKDKEFEFGEKSPLGKSQKEQFLGLEYYPPSLSFKVDVDVEVFPVKEVVTLGATRSKAKKYYRYGKASFRLGNTEHTLIFFRHFNPDPNRPNGFFVPFTDATSGHETYGAGRYLDVTPNKDGSITLDFNRAYNPFCAYNDVYDCPLPPKENYLDIKIEAGEKWSVRHEH